MNDKVPMIYPYARVSTLRQLSGTGLDQQTDQEQLERLSCKHDLPISDGVQDLGKSAYHGEHLKHELGAFIEAVKQGVVSSKSILVVYSLDRLSRLKLGFANQIYLDLTNAGVHIFSTLDNHLYKAHDIGSDVLSSVIFERAHNESATKSKRTVGNALKLINDYQQGTRSANGKVIAIKSVGSLPWFIDGSDGTINKHPYYWDAAKLVAIRIIAGIGIPTIKKELDELYPPIHPPFKRKKWLIGTLRGFHKLEALQGDRAIILQGTRHLLKNYYPKLLSDQDYAQLITARGKRDAYPVRKEVNLITGIGIARCSCGSAVANRRRNDHRATLFCLSGTRKENDCSGWYMSLAYAENALLTIGKDVFARMELESQDISEIELLKLTLKKNEKMLSTMNQRALDNNLPASLLASMVLIESEIFSLQNKIKIKQIDLLKVDTSLQAQWSDIQLPSVNDFKKRTQLKALIKKSINKITMTRVKKSHFLIKFEFANAHVREVEMIKGKLKTVSINKRPMDYIGVYRMEDDDGYLIIDDEIEKPLTHDDLDQMEAFSKQISSKL